MGGILKTFHNNYLQRTLNDVPLYIFVIILLCITLPSIVIIGKCCIKYIRKAYALKVLDAAIRNEDTIKCIKIIEEYPDLVNVRESRTGYTSFLKACLYGNTQLVKFMLQKGANIYLTTNRKESAIYLATYNLICNSLNTDASCLHTLFHAGVDINLPNENGLTPLQMAAMFGHTRLVKWLLSKGADMKVFPRPYILARSQGHIRTAALLNTRQWRAIVES